MTRTLFTFLHNKIFLSPAFVVRRPSPESAKSCGRLRVPKLIVIAPWCGGSFDLLELPCEAEGELRDMLV
jgi:hypothetical protein